jgi:hypothetical protein
MQHHNVTANIPAKKNLYCKLEQTSKPTNIFLNEQYKNSDDRNFQKTVMHLKISKSAFRFLDYQCLSILHAFYLVQNIKLVQLIPLHPCCCSQWFVVV